MAKFEYIGRTGRFLGKSLPQICLKLKNFGVGRMFTRKTYERYPGSRSKTTFSIQNVMLRYVVLLYRIFSFLKFKFAYFLR